MRLVKGSVAHISHLIEKDLLIRESNLHKPHISALADIVTCAMGTQSVNTSEWANVLPRKVKDPKSKERYIRRFLSNDLIDPADVMGSFIEELCHLIHEHEHAITLMMDQSKISDNRHVLMIALRLKNRALPAVWKVVETDGGIGFDVQKELLESVLTMIPDHIPVVLMGDRFYGTKALIEWCQNHKWHYRIRLKKSIKIHYQGKETTPGELLQRGKTSLEDARLYHTNIHTHIGMIHEEGHEEPWIIAMDQLPSESRTLDYGMRWSIECLFSDFKSRGFGITKTNIRHTDRLDKLILVLTLAFYWAASTGMKPRESRSRGSKKND